MARRHTIEEVRESFEKEGYKLLSTEYKNNKEKLEYICPKGHHHEIKGCSWFSGQRCGFCAKNKKMTYEEVKNSFEKEGYGLLSTIYTNNSEYLNYI
jgi:uncharacterized protein YkuJ